MLPSAAVSLTPVTTTVCGVAQFDGVKVRLLTETVPSVVSLEETAIVTSAAGAASRKTWKLAVPPASVVMRPPGGTTAMPGRRSASAVTSAAVKAPAEAPGGLGSCRDRRHACLRFRQP